MGRDYSDEEVKQARFRYEHATTKARHDRDMAISAAWLAFEKTMAAEWASYMEKAAPLEEAQQTYLKGRI